MPRLLLRCCAVVLGLFWWGAALADDGVRLYTLDCGHAEFKDFAAASDTGAHDGQPAVLADPCFLVRHPRGWLLWDAGLPAELPPSITGGATPAEVFDRLGFRVTPGRPLVEQLQALGLVPDDIGLLAFSHLHFDHVGQAGSFPHATWIVNRAELAWAQARPSHVSIAPELLAPLARARQRPIDGDHDVFGDGRVRILQAPGHTPGSSVLLLRLAHAGAVLLSGDLYLCREGREHGEVPVVNADRADTLASMQRIETLVRRLRARVIVQHDTADFERLPRAPAYLD